MLSLKQILISLGLSAAMLAAYSPALTYVAGTAREAVQYQEDTVSTAENLGLTCAVPARAQWETRKAVALSRIAAIEEVAGTTPDELTTTDTTSVLQSGTDIFSGAEPSDNETNRINNQ